MRERIIWISGKNFPKKANIKGESEVKVKVTQWCPTLCNPMDCSPWNSPGQNTIVGSLFLIQGIFPNQGLNVGLPHCRLILHQLSHKGSPMYKINSKFMYNTYAAKSLQSCLTLCDPTDGSPPGSAIPGTLQARTLEWVAI